MWPIDCPSNAISPSLGSISRQMMREVVLLPEPDSPTRPTLSPATDRHRKIGDRRRALIEPFDQLLNLQQRRRTRRRCRPRRRDYRYFPASVLFRDQVRDPRTRRGRRRHQTLGVGMFRGVEEPQRLSLLDQLALLHHNDTATVARRQTEIVGDQDGRHAALGRDPGQQVHHDFLRRDVEARRRLVGNQQRRIAGDRHGDHHALAHAAGEFVRIGRHPLFGIANLHGAQQPQRLRPRFIARHALVGA